MRARLAAIAWERYATAYGNAAGQHAFETAAGVHGETWGSIADQLQGLASEDPQRIAAAPVFERFAGHANDELAHFARALVAALAARSAIV